MGYRDRRPTRGPVQPTNGEQKLALAPQGDLLAIAHRADQPLQLYDTATDKETAQLKDHTQVISLDFSPDGLMLATSDLNSKLQIWDTQSRETRVISENAGWITNLAFSPDGTRLASISWQGVLQLWDISSGLSVDSQIGHTRPVTSITFSPDGKLLASGGEDGVIWVWDVEANSLAMVFLGHFSSVTGLAFSPDGGLLASSSFDSTVRLWNTRSAQQIAVLSGHESYVRCVAFSPDGKTVASGSTDGTVRLWDTVTGEERAMLSGHGGEVESLSFSPDGNWLVSASADKSLRLWNVTTGKESSVLQGHLSPALGVAFSPDGSTLASVGQDFYMRLWKWEIVSGVATAKQSASPRGHSGSVLSVAFSPNGDIVADASMSTWSYYVAPGEIHLYSADTAYPYVMLRGHTKRVTSIAFSPDGKLLASGSADGSIRLWGTQQKGSELASQTLAAMPTPRPNVTADLFSGVWTATDPKDGSNLTMEITFNENSYNIAYVDDGASVCGKDGAGNPLYAIEIDLSGNASGDVLYAVSTSATCLSSPASPLDLEISVNYSHRAETDTLWDSMDNTQWERRPASSGRNDFNGSLTEVWHRLNPNQIDTTPEHEVLICEWKDDVNCSYFKQAEPTLGFEDPPDSTTGSFLGHDVTAAWACPVWFPSDICDNLKFVASGVMSLKLSDGGEFAGSQDVIIANHGGEQILYIYWTEQGFYCPWYEDFDMALAANPFPTPFNGLDGPLMDCNQAPGE
jgi:WD40 repeat protein